MTKDEFLNQLDALLNDYCTANPDYQNIHVKKVITRINTPKVKEGVNVAIDTYLYRKEG